MFFGNTRKQKITTLVILIAIVLICVTIYNVRNSERKATVSSGNSEFTVHIIDVGQGNAAFIDNGDKDILIDAGDTSTTDMLLDYLDALNVKDIEYMFLTHPHEDHIGSADEILERYNVANVVIPDARADTNCYYDMMDAIEASNAKLHYGKKGDTFNIGNTEINIFSPAKGADYANLNLYSFIMRVDYEESSFLFAGDAESENEKYVLKRYKDQLDCDLLCVGHHGSSTSSTKKFLDAVTPEIAVISVGEDNSYGHPHAEVLSRLDDYTDDIYRTDEHGDIVIGCDGDNIWIAQ